jgi:hypothetical protein
VGQRQGRRAAAFSTERAGAPGDPGGQPISSRRLARLRVLDPACGTGNFLYVTLEHLKRLEAEVLELLRELGTANCRWSWKG